MVVQHNVTAMNANRQLGITTGIQAKSSEKLSSGYKINRAADDAAGLAISEKMRRQVRGLTQASANAQDGISAVQTAEGALNEVHDMLQRMNELATKAANETLQSTDRAYIDAEISQLKTEIDRTGSATQFNNQKLLDGSFKDKKLQVGSETDGENQITVTIGSMKCTGIGITGSNCTVAGTDGSKALKAMDTIKNLDNVVENTQAAESQIRDTDMATEMVKYSNNNILAQAGQSMLAQANQTNQGVLSLLG